MAATGQAHHANLPASLDNFLKSEGALIACRGCGEDCSQLYFHAPATKLNVCAACFSSGRYGAEASASDFIKIDPNSFATTAITSDWSDEETFKLLEAVEKYSDSGVNMAANNVWDAIAETVGRSRESCLLQFLRLPIVESLNNNNYNNPATLPASFLTFPFSQSENPALSVITFLAGNVHPRVASAAAQAALAEISKNDLEGADMQAVASVALASSAAHAHDLAQAEEKRLQHWRDILLETQLKKLQLKLDSLDELERVVEEDRKEVEKQRLQIFMERFNLRKMLLHVEQRSGSSN